MVTTLSPCDMCTGAILLYEIPRVVVGENRTFKGGEELLRSRGVEVVVLDDRECSRDDGGLHRGAAGACTRTSANSRRDARQRFAVHVSNAPSGEAWLDLARRAEALGYDTLLVPDHSGHQLSPIAALAAAAAVTSRLRIGPYVFANDFRHLLVMAREALPSTSCPTAGWSWGWVPAGARATTDSWDCRTKRPAAASIGWPRPCRWSSACCPASRSRMPAVTTGWARRRCIPVRCSGHAHRCTSGQAGHGCCGWRRARRRSLASFRSSPAPAARSPPTRPRPPRAEGGDRATGRQGALRQAGAVDLLRRCRDGRLRRGLAGSLGSAVKGAVVQVGRVAIPVVRDGGTAAGEIAAAP